MKHLIATALSLSVLLSSAALAAPQGETLRAGTAPLAQPAPAQPAVLPQRAQPVRPPAQVAGQPIPPPAAGAPRHMRHGMHERGHGPRAHGPSRHSSSLHHRGQRGHGHRAEGRGPGRMQLGAPLAERQQGVVVSKPRQHGLAKAPRGQEWRKVGQRYVRVTSGTNVVNEIVINGL